MKRSFFNVLLLIFFLSVVSCSFLEKKVYAEPDRRVYGLKYLELIDATQKTLHDLNLDYNEFDVNHGNIKAKDYEIKIVFVSNHISGIKIISSPELYNKIFNKIEEIKKPDILDIKLKW